MSARRPRDRGVSLFTCVLYSVQSPPGRPRPRSLRCCNARRGGSGRHGGRAALLGSRRTTQTLGILTDEPYYDVINTQITPNIDENALACTNSQTT